MGATRVSNDEFFARLPELFVQQRKQDGGSVFLTQKRLSHDLPRDILPAATPDQPFPDLAPNASLPILVRASIGQKQAKRAISTIVESKDLEKFFSRYAEACKVEMQGLKKRDRNKLKAKLKAKKKKGSVAPGEGDKRP